MNTVRMPLGSPVLKWVVITLPHDIIFIILLVIHLAGTAMNLNRKLLTLSVALIPKRTAMRGKATMYLPRKNSENRFRRRKKAWAETINVYQLVSYVTYWSTLTNASLLKIAIKHIGTLCFCILFTKFAYRMPNFIQNDLEQWRIRTTTIPKQRISERIVKYVCARPFWRLARARTFSHLLNNYMILLSILMWM